MSEFSIYILLTVLVHMPFIRTEKTCKCGVSDTTGMFIVGGRQATPHEFPWMVLVLSKFKVLGAGALINDRYVLTAAHVLIGQDIESIKVFLGIHNKITMDNTNPVFFKPEKLILHPSFDKEKTQADIGLIKLPEPVVFKSGKIWPICLPPSDLTIYARHTTIAGWGRQKYNGQTSRVLKKAVVKTMNFKECMKTSLPKAHPKLYNITEPDNIFCARGSVTDACQGDSGGPLMLRHKGRYIVIGIISSGVECGKPEYPGIYTNVLYYVEWILNNTHDANYCQAALK